MRAILPLLALVTCAEIEKREILDEDGDGFDMDEDCDDGDPSAYPGGSEVCDDADVDEDCDGLADDADDDATGKGPFYLDSDGDTYGDADASALACDPPEGYVADGTDCDDRMPRINPAAQEVCDDRDTDEDCDGLVDEDDPSVDPATGVEVWPDTDGDGYGDDAEGPLIACEVGAGFADVGGDCDDLDPDVNPGANEVWYDGTDQDCDGNDTDQDEDGYSALTFGGGDCDDTDPTVNPGASQTWYDGTDQDCDGQDDWDQDGDGVRADEGDCDDTDPETYPGAFEGDSDDDNDCDGQIEGGPVAIAYYDYDESTLEQCLPIYLDGSDSYDPDGGALTYDWELLAAPSGSVRTTNDVVTPDIVDPVFTPDVEGDYDFSLVVTNETDAVSLPSLLTLKVLPRTNNSAPVADAGPDQSSSQSVRCTASGYGAYSCASCSNVAFSLDGGASSDADGEALSYSWAIASGSGSLSTTTGQTTTVTVSAPAADYGVTNTNTATVQLEVEDCFGDVSLDTVTVTLSCTGT
ncbi:MAG: MopE-related protein [Myxococcota bacterium]